MKSAKKFQMISAGVLLFSTALLKQSAQAQSWTGSGGNLTTANAVKVGIGITIPPEKLTVNDGNIALTRTDAPNDIGSNNFRYISAKTQRSLLYIGTDPGPAAGANNGGACIMMAAPNNGWIPGRINYYSASKIGGSMGDITSQEFLNWNASKNNYITLLSLKDYNGKSLATIGEVPLSSCNTNGLIVAGDISNGTELPTRATIGAANDGNGLWGTGYIGFNLKRDNSTTAAVTGASTWPYNGNGTYNGGSVIYGRLDGDIVFSTKSNTGGAGGSITDVDILQNSKMRLTNDGKLVIASQTVNIWGGSGPSIDYTSGNYKLFVEKGILTERVRVAVKGSAEWADYVFDDNYKLMPLQHLETFINKEKHLPGIATTAQVVKEGVDIGQMQAKLLQKVEELTKYIIQQQHEIEALKTERKRQSR